MAVTLNKTKSATNSKAYRDSYHTQSHVRSNSVLVVGNGNSEPGSFTITGATAPPPPPLLSNYLTINNRSRGEFPGKTIDVEMWREALFRMKMIMIITIMMTGLASPS